jgi:predicted nuclease of predicted toxin-antitoxin system
VDDAQLWIRPYLDHNVHPWIADDLRRRGFDVVFAREVGNAAAADEEHLRWATDHGRTVFTYDRRDFPRLHRDWRIRGEMHAGIIVSVAPPELPASEMLRRLRHLLDSITADEMVGQIEWLDARW